MATLGRLRPATKIVRVPRNIIPISPVPKFPASVQGVWKFDGTLEDIVGSQDFTPSSGSATYKEFSKFELLPNRIVTRSALLFEAGKTYSSLGNYTFTNDITISFWYFSPGLVGFTRHFVTRELEPKQAPVLAKANSSTTSNQTILNTSSFVITEIGYSKTKNALRVYLTSDGGNISHVITSDEFEPGLHHVLMTFSRSRGRIRIDIDGKTGIQHTAPTTSLSRAGQFRINNIVPGYLAHKTVQEGAYLYDLVFTTYASLDNESLKAFRYGYEHISFDNLFDSRFAYFGMSYAQPTTISTTHIFVDGGNIFAARSNGKIVKGARPVWDTEANYPDAASVGLLTTSQVDPVPKNDSSDERKKRRFLEWTPSGLNLRGVSIRI